MKPNNNIKNFHSQLKGMFNGGAGVNSTNSFSAQVEGMSTATQMLLEEQQRSNDRIEKLLLQNQKIIKKQGADGLGLLDLVMANYLPKFLKVAGAAIGGAIMGAGGFAAKGIRTVTTGIAAAGLKGPGVVLGFFKNAFSAGFSQITKMGKGMVTVVSAKVGSAMTKMASIVAASGKLLAKLPKLMGKLFWPVTALMGLYDGFKGWGNAEKLLGRDNVGFLGRLGSAMGAALNGLLLGIPNWVIGKFGGGNLSQLLDKGGSWVGNITSSLVGATKSFVLGAVNATTETLSNMWNSLPTAAQMFETLPNVAQTVLTGLTTLGSNIMDAATEMFDNAWKSVKDWWNKPWFGSDEDKAAAQVKASDRLKRDSVAKLNSRAYAATVQTRGRRAPQKNLENVVDMKTRNDLVTVANSNGLMMAQTFYEGQDEVIKKIIEKYDLNDKDDFFDPSAGGGGGGGVGGGHGPGTGRGHGSSSYTGGGHGPGMGRASDTGGSTSEPPKSELVKMWARDSKSAPTLGPTMRAAESTEGGYRDMTARVNKADMGDASRQQWNADTYKFLKEEHGFTHDQAKTAAAGFTGNAAVESGGFNKMREVGQGKNRGGYGVVQWTASRRKEFAKFASERGMDINNPDHVNDYNLNFDFFKHELNNTSEKKVLKHLRKDGLSAQQSADIVSKVYERPGVPHIKRRRKEAIEASKLSLVPPTSDTGGFDKLESSPTGPSVPAGTLESDTFAAPPGMGGASSDPSRLVPMPKYKKQQGGMKGVDPRLQEIMQATREAFPLRTQFVSGKAGRGKGEHSRGNAMDFIMYDTAGNAMPNYGKESTEYFRAYEAFHQLAMQKGKEMHPELFDGKGKDFNSGLFFGDGRGEGTITSADGRTKGTKYGSIDGMDVRLSENNKFRAGNLMGGLNPSYKGIWDKGDLLGGSKPYSPEALSKTLADLEGWEMTPAQAAKAKTQLAHTAKTYGGKGIGRDTSRKSGGGSMYGLASVLAGMPSSGSPMLKDIMSSRGLKRSSGSMSLFEQITGIPEDAPDLSKGKGKAPAFAVMQSTSSGHPYQTDNPSAKSTIMTPTTPTPAAQIVPPVDPTPAPAADSQVQYTPPAASPPPQPVQPQENLPNKPNIGVNDVPAIDETSMLAINGSALT